MAATSRLQLLSEADLDGLIAEMRRQGTRELVLLGPRVELSASVDYWPQQLRDKPRIYKLKWEVPDMARRLAALTQLTSLNLWDLGINDEGTAHLAAFTQLGGLHPAHLPQPGEQLDR
jgi:hypothetical protein